MIDKYLGIKVKGINHWFWFEKSKVVKENGYFVGVNGWGKSGYITSIKVKEENIEGEIFSDTLQLSF